MPYRPLIFGAHNESAPPEGSAFFGAGGGRVGYIVCDHVGPESLRAHSGGSYIYRTENSHFSAFFFFFLTFFAFSSLFLPYAAFSRRVFTFFSFFGASSLRFFAFPAYFYFRSVSLSLIFSNLPVYRNTKLT
jgi:hypothetical protein